MDNQGQADGSQLVGQPETPSLPTERVQLVEPGVSRAKLERELDAWNDQADLYRRRGWLLLRRDDLMVEVAFVAPVTLPTGTVLPVVTACIRLDYTNYDLEPPSLHFLDVWTREPAAPPVQPVQVSTSGELQSLMPPGVHPLTGLPFLCLPGVLEYHTHPEHSGDLWLVGHRAQGAGRLATICERIWQAMGRHLGLAISLQPVVALGHNLDTLRQEAAHGAGLGPVPPAQPEAADDAPGVHTR